MSNIITKSTPSPSLSLKATFTDGANEGVREISPASKDVKSSYSDTTPFYGSGQARCEICI